MLKFEVVLFPFRLFSNVVEYYPFRKLCQLILLIHQLGRSKDKLKAKPSTILSHPKSALFQSLALLINSKTYVFRFSIYQDSKLKGSGVNEQLQALQSNQPHNKFIFDMKVIGKDNPEPFEGWAYDSSINRDEIILADIIRNSTMGALPPLHNLKIRNSFQPEIHNQVKLQSIRLKRISNKEASHKRVRQKTEGFNQFYDDAISPLKKKLVEILNEQEVESTQFPITQEQVNENLSQLNKSKVQVNQQQSLYPQCKQNIDQKQGKKGVLEGKDKQMRKSQLKRTNSKMYMKLNALQALHDFKNSLYRQPLSIHNLTSKNRFTQQNLLNNNTKTFKNIFAKKFQIEEKVEKVNEKLKQTFFKFDVFQKEKKKKPQFFKRGVITQFNDQVIFTNSPFKMTDKSLAKRISPLKTIQKDTHNIRDASVPLKILKPKSPHRHKLTIN